MCLAFLFEDASPLKPPPNFKFKYFYTSHNPSDGSPFTNSNVASNNRSEI